MNEAGATASALIILARMPRQGRVKSRLAATIGSSAAAASYRLMAEHLFSECERLPPAVARYLFYADARDAGAIRSWAGNTFQYAPQRPGDFGQRMMAAFQTVFEEGARKAVIVGSDVPDLSAEIIGEALHLLDRYPIVIGPDRGGGYYLLGLKMVYPALFLRRLPWGTHLVLGRTLQIIRELGLAPAFLPHLIDVDVEGDLWQWRRQALAGLAPSTSHPLAAYLRQLDQTRGADGDAP
jgi:uncharacterized protein